MPSRMKNTSNSDEITQEHLILKSGNDQDYGKVEKLLGNCRVSLLCNDKETRVGIIRGNMRKRQWLNIGSIVIYSMRAYEKNKVDIIHVYNNNVLKMHKTCTKVSKQCTKMYKHRTTNVLKRNKNVPHMYQNLSNMYVYIHEYIHTVLRSI